MASISAIELATDVLDSCLRDGTWPARSLDALIERALDTDYFVASAASRAFFSIVIERLGDLFEPALCDVYAKLFAHVIARAMPEYDARELLVRYRNIRQTRRFRGGEIERVFILSRVTLGADIAVTSVAMAAAKERFPDAEICLVGPEKNAELFAADERIVPITVAYARQSLLRDRLSAALELKTMTDQPGTIVIDPDSRLTQLGLIPVCDDARYFFFESRAFGGDLLTSLPELTSIWCNEAFDTPQVVPYVAPDLQRHRGDITVSFGVGENEDKRIDSDFEGAVLKALLDMGMPILIDRGAGGEEADRVNSLLAEIANPEQIAAHDGSYSSFASHILQSRLYVGYDSAGQHVASAGNVPLVSIFAGFACRRMLARWSPSGPNAHVVPIDGGNRQTALSRTLKAIDLAAAPVPS